MLYTRARTTAPCLYISIDAPGERGILTIGLLAQEKCAPRPRILVTGPGKTLQMSPPLNCGARCAARRTLRGHFWCCGAPLAEESAKHVYFPSIESTVESHPEGPFLESVLYGMKKDFTVQLLGPLHASVLPSKMSCKYSGIVASIGTARVPVMAAFDEQIWLALLPTWLRPDVFAGKSRTQVSSALITLAGLANLFPEVGLPELLRLI